MKKRYKIALSIAGSDPSGGAGLQADLKTFSACGCYGATAVVAVVDENTRGVTGVFPVSPSFVRGQIKSVLDDLGADAVKIGMLHSAEMVRTVKDTLAEYDVRNIVLITPNIPEAEILLGEKILSQNALPDCARRLSQGGKVSVLLKAGHLSDAELVDVFYNAETDNVMLLPSRRLDTPNTHGTGCTLSSAVAAFLARGFALDDAVRNAKEYIGKAIEAGAGYEIGHGHGPVHHFFNFWE